MRRAYLACRDAIHPLERLIQRVDRRPGRAVMCSGVHTASNSTGSPNMISPSGSRSRLKQAARLSGPMHP